MKTKTTLINALTVAALFMAGTAQADTVQGQFALEGKPPLKPTEVAAFHMGNSTLVMLTTKPVNKTKIADSVNSDELFFMAINDPAVHGADWISLTVSPKGSLSMNASVGGTQYIDSSTASWGTLRGLCTDSAPEHLACGFNATVKTKWSVDITFDTAIQPAQSSKPGNK